MQSNQEKLPVLHSAKTLSIATAARVEGYRSSAPASCASNKAVAAPGKRDAVGGAPVRLRLRRHAGGGAVAVAAVIPAR
jgi:hypothetical protein